MKPRTHSRHTHPAKHSAARGAARGRHSAGKFMDKSSFALRSRKILVIAVAVLVVVLAALLFLYFRRQATPPTSPAPSTQPPLTHAPSGELTPGFPKELVLDAKAKLADSYTINYNQNLNQYTASYDSDKSMLSLFAEYKDYFKNNGWAIVNEITIYKTSRGLYAKKDKSDASVAIIDRKPQRQVTVSYLVK